MTDRDPAATAPRMTTRAPGVAVDTTEPREEHYDLLVLGSGSGNSVPDEDLGDWRVAVVEPGTFGGTCLNRGCIPSKMYVVTADIARTVSESSRHGVVATLDGVDWPAVRDRVFGRIDPIAEAGRQYRGGLPNTDLYEGSARFVADRRVEVGAVTITADRVVLAVGSRVLVPPIPGLDDVPVVTSDEVMRLEQQPRRLLVLGGGFVGVEMGHVFDAFGSDVTIVTRGDSLVSSEDDEVRHALTAAYRDRGVGVLTGSLITSVERGDDDPVVATVATPDGELRTTADLLLIATGRISNADTLDLAAAGVEVDHTGTPLVDEFQRTSATGVWSLGDVSSAHWLKHVANAEARAVAHNVRHPDDPQPTMLSTVPSAVFGDPQVASVGAREKDLVGAGVPYLRGRRDYGGTAYGWALEDETSFAKVLVDPDTRRLLGAHVLGPHASLVIQPLVQAMSFGTSIDDVARVVVYIHPALSEVVENVLLDVDEPSG